MQGYRNSLQFFKLEILTSKAWENAFQCAATEFTVV
jgi:hypothetical protein